MRVLEVEEESPPQSLEEDRSARKSSSRSSRLPEPDLGDVRVSWSAAKSPPHAVSILGRQELDIHTTQRAAALAARPGRWMMTRRENAALDAQDAADDDAARATATRRVIVPWNDPRRHGSHMIGMLATGSVTAAEMLDEEERRLAVQTWLGRAGGTLLVWLGGWLAAFATSKAERTTPPPVRAAAAHSMRAPAARRRVTQTAAPARDGSFALATA